MLVAKWSMNLDRSWQYNDTDDTDDDALLDSHKKIVAAAWWLCRMAPCSRQQIESAT